MIWKDFFYYSKGERRGIIVLVVLIITFFLTPKLLRISAHTDEVPPMEENEFEKEYYQFISSLEEVKPPERSYRGVTNFSSEQKEITLFYFDPNTADSTTFVRLGLPNWMARNILRYRNKQGKFRRAEDFRKIYGLTEENYQALRPYIRLVGENGTEHLNTKDTIRLITELKIARDSLVKHRAGTVVGLNTADTTELKKIPGIGSGIARMIVSYRKRLGGFHRIEQLGDIDLKAEKLRPWFSIDTGLIHRINLNKASMERMMYHPYINYYQAKVITEYRKKKGTLKELKQLSLYEEFTASDFEKLGPYVCFD